MKKFFCIVSLLTILACNNEQDKSFSVEGNVKNVSAKTIYLEMNSAESRPVIVDSSQPDKNGQFSLTTDVTEESLFSLRTDQSPYPFAVLINDSRKISVDADLSNPANSYTVKGSEASESILRFEKNLGTSSQNIFAIKKRIDSLNMMITNDSLSAKYRDSLINSSYTEYEKSNAEMKKYAADLIEKSNSPMFVLYALGSYQVRNRQMGETGFNKTEVAAILNKAAAKFPQHTAINEQKKKFGSNKAPEFSLPDTSGKMVSLSAFKGKYVLVDFWASWCKPCRIENPNIVAAYNEFRNKNFTILGVSLDKDKNMWMQAIKSDGLQWTHISDLQHWNSAAAQLYGVNSIPYNVLVDPEGNIIAEALHGRDLVNTLQRVLK